jgi:hypothetical protein
MKKIHLLFAILSVFILNSCQDVVDIPLNTDKPRLVVEASINWEKGDIGDTQTIKLTTTTNYYSNTIPVVSGAIVTVTNSSNVVFNFIETPNTGLYNCTNFVPVIDEVYTLKIINKGDTYTATETLKSVAPIQNITQEIQVGPGGDALKIKGNFVDPANVDNYYLYKFSSTNSITPSYNSDEDTFFQGNPFFSLKFIRDYKVGDFVAITHYGISKEYYNYMNILLSIAGGQGGGPFATPSATVKGNIKNETNFDNYPLGYFRLSESSTKTYIVQ